MYNKTVPFEWDPIKAAATFESMEFNSQKRSAYSDDDYAITIEDDESDPNEQRFVTLGVGIKGRVLVVVYCYRGENLRMISARPAVGLECEEYEAQQ